MKKANGFFVTLAFVGLLIGGSANAAPIADYAFQIPVMVTEGSFSQTLNFDFAPIFNDGDKEGIIGFQLAGEGNQTLTFDNGDTVYSSGIQALFDPVITGAIGVVDFGAPSSFAVAIAAPLSPPITTAAVGSLTISGSFADAGADGGSATPFLHPGIAQATIEGVGVADAGPPAVFGTAGDTYGPFTVPYNIDCSSQPDGQCDSFDLQIAFTGSGNNDAISFTARHEITPVPIPAAIMLLGSALVTMLGIRRRFKY